MHRTPPYGPSKIGDLKIPERQRWRDTHSERTWLKMWIPLFSIFIAIILTHILFLRAMFTLTDKVILGKEILKVSKATSFPGFSPTRPTERAERESSVGRVGENPGNEVVSKVHTIPGSFCAASKIIPDGASVHTQARLWRRDFCNGAKLRCADF